MKPFLRLIFLLLAVIVSAPLVLLTALRFSGISANYFKNSLSKNNVYSEVSTEIVKYLDVSPGLVSAKYLQVKTEKLIDDIDLWLAGKGPSPVLSFSDLSPKNTAELRSLLTELKSKQIATQRREALEKGESFDSGDTSGVDKFIEDGFSLDVGQNLSQLKEIYWWQTQGYLILVATALLSLTLIILLSENNKERFTWVGFTFLAVLLWNILPFAAIFFSQGLLRGLILESPELPAIGKEVYKTITTPIFESINKIGTFTLIGLLVVTIVAFVASSFGNSAQVKKTK